MTVFFEVAATLLGLVQGALIMLGKRSSWIFYTLQMACLAVFSLLSRLYGDTVNSLLYFVLGIVGFCLADTDLNRSRFKGRILRQPSPKTLVISAYNFEFLARLASKSASLKFAEL